MVSLVYPNFRSSIILYIAVNWAIWDLHEFSRNWDDEVWSKYFDPGPDLLLRGEARLCSPLRSYIGKLFVLTVRRGKISCGKAITRVIFHHQRHPRAISLGLGLIFCSIGREMRFWNYLGMVKYCALYTCFDGSVLKVQPQPHYSHSF